MRAAKWLTIITIVLTIIFLVLSVLFYFYKINLAYDISLAIFGGSILGFIMSLIEYYAAKRQSMETFYKEALRAISRLGKAKFFLINEPTNLVLNCISEEFSNKFTVSELIPIKYESKERFIDFYKQGFPTEITDSLKFIEYAEDWYSKTMQGYYSELEKSMDIYIELPGMQLGELDNAYGNLDFIIANRTLRKLAYEQIYNPIKEFKESVVREAYHFQLYKAGEGNISDCTNFLLKLNEKWFSKKEVNRDEIHSVTIYQKYYDMLEDSVEKFRCKIYNQKYREDEHKPIISRIYQIKHEDK